MPSGKALNPEFTPDIVDLYQQGKTVIEIGRLYGVLGRPIARILKKAEVHNRGRSTITDTIKNQIIGLYREGKSTYELAKQFNTSLATIYYTLEKWGATNEQKRLTDIDKASIVRAYVAGSTTTQIAKDFSLSEGTAFKVIEAASVEFRNRRGKINSHKDKIIELYKAGVSMGSIGSEIGFSGATVKGLLVREGVTLRSMREIASKNWQNSEYANAVNSKRVIQRGAQSHRWQGGKTKLTVLLRMSARYREWRTAVFVRDNATCQHCGAKGHKTKNPLQADHIYPFSALLHDHQIRTVEQAEACTKLWDIGNGRTLCKSCHEKTDTYGNRAKKYLKPLSV